jgi:hypothetical protein
VIDRRGIRFWLMARRSRHPAEGDTRRGATSAPDHEEASPAAAWVSGVTARVAAWSRSNTDYCLLLVLASLIAIGSLVPGRPVAAWSEVLADLQAGATLAVQDPAFATVLERFATFLPLGWLTWQRLGRHGFRHPIVVSCTAVALFALALELGQSVVQSRHGRLSDFLLAVAFAWLGAGIGAWLGTPPSPARVRRLLLMALVLGNTTLTFLVAESHLGAEIKGWDCGFPLVVANEISGDRPWRGGVRAVAIYPRALPADDVARLATVPFSTDGLRIRQDADALMVYPFDRVRGRRVPQVLPDGPEVDMLLPPSGPATWRSSAGALEVLGPILIQGNRPPRELCTAILASGAFAIELALASADLAQDGPARIVSHSIDPYARNFTLAQDGRALVLRVRTPWNGPNGNRMELRAENVLGDRAWHHVVASYDRGMAAVFVDGEPGALVRYDALMWLSDTHVVRLAAFAAVAFAGLGLVAGSLFGKRSWRRRTVYAYLLAALVPVGATLLLGVQLGHDPDWWLIAAALTGPGAGLLTREAWSRLSASSP